MGHSILLQQLQIYFNSKEALDGLSDEEKELATQINQFFEKKAIILERLTIIAEDAINLKDCVANQLKKDMGELVSKSEILRGRLQQVVDEFREITESFQEAEVMDAKARKFAADWEARTGKDAMAREIRDMVDRYLNT